MRKLIRTEAPVCLQNNAANWNAEFVSARIIKPTHKFSWRNTVCYNAIRQALVSMTQQHCAFCDGPIGSESRETVEHFRPKRKFPELAYDWDNLFPCCDMCQSTKLEQFDEALLKPDLPDYFFHHYFIVNYRTGEIEPAENADESAKQRAQTTIELYGLKLEKRNIMRLRELQHYMRDPNPQIDDYNYRYFLD